MLAALASPAHRSRGRLFVVLVALAACGDAAGPGPEPQLIGLELPDTVHLDAIRDSVRLPAELIYSNGHREPLTDGAWSGNGGDAATLHPDGWIWTRGEGALDASVSYASLSASTVVVIRRQGRILITFDDGWRSARTVALPALTEAGLTATVAVVVDAIGWDAYLNPGDLDALKAAGWAFVSHSMTHADLPFLSAEDLEWELAESRAWLLGQGLRTADAFIVPYHSWGERERAAVQRHYRAARGATVDWVWPEFVAEWRPVDPFGITSIDASSLLRTAEGRAEIMARVRHAITAGQLLDLMFHDIQTADVDGFRALVAELASERLRLFTWADLFPVVE
jgi:peptidoglycan/xylan/chitin deacetylase (PgdA/CDA1 family)